MQKSCENCGKPFDANTKGRPRRFCSTKCSVRKGFIDREASRRDVSGGYDSSGATQSPVPTILTAPRMTVAITA